MKIFFAFVLTFFASNALLAVDAIDVTYLIGRHYQSHAVQSFIQHHYLIDDIAEIENQWRTPSYLENAKYIGGYDPNKKKVVHPIELQAFDGIITTINIYANQKMDKKVSKRYEANGFYEKTFWGGFRFDMKEAEAAKEFVFFEANSTYRKFISETMMLSFSYSKKKGVVKRITYGTRYDD